MFELCRRMLAAGFGAVPPPCSRSPVAEPIAKPRVHKREEQSSGSRGEFAWEGGVPTPTCPVQKLSNEARVEFTAQV